MTNQPLEDKVALITGAAGAIGYGVCQVLLENGRRVAATDLAGPRLDEFVRDIDAIMPGKSIGVPLDVTDSASTKKAFEAVSAEFGQLHIVVHNAGIAYVSKIIDMDISRFQQLEKVNIEGTLMVLAEAACHQLGRIASLEFAEHDIRVNMVAPDAVFAEGKYRSGLWDLVGSDRMKARGIDEQQLHEYYRNRNLLKTAVTGRHVANAVLYFLTRQSPTTGATIPVDGGLADATPGRDKTPKIHIGLFPLPTISHLQLQPPSIPHHSDRVLGFGSYVAQAGPCPFSWLTGEGDGLRHSWDSCKDHSPQHS